jgi:hypothetical protein
MGRIMAAITAGGVMRVMVAAATQAVEMGVALEMVEVDDIPYPDWVSRLVNEASHHDTHGDFNRWPATPQSLHGKSRWYAKRLVRAV